MTLPLLLIPGLASDGGLFVPRAWPRFTTSEIAGLAGLPYAELAAKMQALLAKPVSGVSTAPAPAPAPAPVALANVGRAPAPAPAVAPAPAPAPAAPAVVPAEVPPTSGWDVLPAAAPAPGAPRKRGRA